MVTNWSPSLTINEAPEATLTFFLSTFAYLNVYDSRLLLRPQRTLSIILRGVVFWFAILLGVSLALKFEPKISRLFVAYSCGTTLLAMVGWHFGFYQWLVQSRYRMRIPLWADYLFLGWLFAACTNRGSSSRVTSGRVN